MSFEPEFSTKFGSMVSFGFNKESAFLGSSCYSSLEAFQNKFGTTVYYSSVGDIFQIWLSASFTSLL